MTRIKFYVVLFLAWLWFGNEDLLPESETFVELDEHEEETYHEKRA